MKTCTVSQLKEALRTGGCHLVDVREASEYTAEHIEAAEHLPLSGLSDRSAGRLAGRGTVFLVCRSGVRAAQAAQKLASWGICDPVVLDGGLNAWTRAGQETVKGSSRVWDLERQVRFAAGLLVLIGVAAGYALDPRFYGLSAFVGAGLVFAAVTNTCGMAMLLTHMPWNRQAGVSCAAAGKKTP